MVTKRYAVGHPSNRPLRSAGRIAAEAGLQPHEVVKVKKLKCGQHITLPGIHVTRVCRRHRRK